MRRELRHLAVWGLLMCVPAWCAAQERAHADDAPAAHADEYPVTQHGDGHAGDGGHDAHGGDKPALLQFDPGAAIWTIIVFFGLLIVLRLTAWKPILRVLHEREAFIASSIEDAKRERAEAEQLLADHKAQLDKARDEAAALLEQGRKDADAARQRLIEEARGEAADLSARAKRDIQLATDTAIKELYDRTAELSVDVAARIINKELSAADHSRLIEESLAAMRAEGKAGLN
jgi:F-type H+-transporting ATPase subunit b